MTIMDEMSGQELFRLVVPGNCCLQRMEACAKHTIIVRLGMFFTFSSYRCTRLPTTSSWAQSNKSGLGHISLWSRWRRLLLGIKMFFNKHSCKNQSYFHIAALYLVTVKIAYCDARGMAKVSQYLNISLQ